MIDNPYLWTKREQEEAKPPAQKSASEVEKPLTKKGDIQNKADLLNNRTWYSFLIKLIYFKYTSTHPGLSDPMCAGTGRK